MKITDLLDKLDSVSAMAVVVVILLIFFVLGWGLSKRNDITDLWNSWQQSRKRKDELLNMLLDDHERMQKYEDARKSDRSQSFEIQKQLIDANKDLANQLADLSHKIDENQKKTDERFLQSEEKNNKRVRAELKDKIGRTYRYHHETQKINDMEFEALKDLIEEYEDHGGTNSFVHETVQPEMYVWERDKKD